MGFQAVGCGQMSALSQTWIRLPPARKGAKCPVSGWGRRKLQNMIYGIPSQGVPPRVRFKRVPGGKGDKGTVFIHVPSLMQIMLGEPELPSDTVAAVPMLADSPDWCQVAMRRMLDLYNDRAGMTVADFISYLLATDRPAVLPE